jgi:hypothetical protein
LPKVDEDFDVIEAVLDEACDFSEPEVRKQSSSGMFRDGTRTSTMCGQIQTDDEAIGPKKEKRKSKVKRTDSSEGEEP